MPRGRESETERSTWPHRRIAGKRAVEDETSSSAKKARIASPDLSLIRSPSESPLPPSDDAMVRLRDKRRPENRSDEQSKRVRVEELAVVPWSGPSGEKRSLDVDDEEQQKKQCIGERSELRLSLLSPLPVMCEVSLGHYVSKFVFGVDVLDLDFWVQINSID